MYIYVEAAQLGFVGAPRFACRRRRRLPLKAAGLAGKGLTWC